MAFQEKNLQQLAFEPPPQVGSVKWDSTCGFLLRFLAGWLEGQSDGWRRHRLDQRDHSTHTLETIPEAEWANLQAPGIVGRLARLSYETTRKMEPDTTLRILAKFPRRKRRFSPEDIDEIAQRIAADPILRERLTPRSLSK